MKQQSVSPSHPSRSSSKRKTPWLFDRIPRWLKYSGLPAYLNEKYGLLAWSIFWALIELDCRFNPHYTDPFDYSFDELAKVTGLCRKTISRYIKRLEKGGFIYVKRGVYTGKKSSFLIINPIKTPKGLKAIHKLEGGLFNSKGKQPIIRYGERGTLGGALSDIKKQKRGTQMGALKKKRGTQMEKRGSQSPYKEKKREEKKEKEKEGLNEKQALSPPASEKAVGERSFDPKVLAKMKRDLKKMQKERPTPYKPEWLGEK